MRSLVALALGSVLGLGAACRAAPSPKPTRDEPARAGAVELTRASCANAALPGCDEYELEVALCLEHPERPMCARMRQRGELPAEPPPLRDAFGCRSTEGPIGPHAVVCLAEDRISILDVAGQWEQWQVAGWERDDTRQRAIWVATLIDGAALRITPIVREHGPRSPTGGPSLGLHVVGAHGLLHATLGARDLQAEDRLATLPNAEEVCRHADACERAIADLHAPPRGDDELESEDPIPSIGPRTLRHCHARWSAAAHGDPTLILNRTVPAACGTLQPEGQWGAPWDVEPPYSVPPGASVRPKAHDRLGSGAR